MLLAYFQSPVDFLLLRSHLESVAVSDSKNPRGLSYHELYTVSSRVARVLVEEYGVTRSVKVAIALQNTVESVIALYGIWMAGGTAVIVDPLSFEEDLTIQLEMSRPKLVIAEREDVERVCVVARRWHVKCTTTEDLVKHAGTGHAWEGIERPRAWHDALIYFYAGIAGRTLEVIHTHSGVAASAVTTSIHFKLGEADRLYTAAPLSHALGLQIVLLASHAAGGSAHLHYRRGRMDPRQVAVELAKVRATVIVGAPTFYKLLLDAGYAGHEGLRFGVSAGAPLPLDVARTWKDRCGTELLQLYGMTEAAPISATLPNDNPPGSVGRPMPGIEVKLVDPEDPNRGAREVGELAVRGPIVMKGYSEPEENSKVFLKGGWMRTGDIVEIRAGHLYFRGVKKRMLKYKGYPIFPRDLELVLEKHPAVARAEVVGEPAGELGQVPVARVWVRKGARVTAGELLEWVNSRVAPYKRIRRVVIEGEVEG
jgi:long-chain acyl-CoA synthetase